MKTLIHCIVKILPGVVLVLLLLEIIVTNELVHYGKNVQDIDRAIDVLQEENEHISQKVASSSSLIAIEEKARVMGFVTSSSAPIVLGNEEFALQNH